MSRLTKKIEDLDFYKISSAYIDEIPNQFLDKDYVGEAINKLGKLEDMEEEVGCPLECVVAVFKAMKQDHIYCDIGNGMYTLHNFRLDYVDLADDVYFTRSEYHYVLDDDCCIFVKDYKNTWWLKEDKSE